MGDSAVQREFDDESSRARAASPTREAGGRIQLSQREVERVIARAVELQQDREVSRGTGLTLDDLQDVVAQLGVEADLVRRALDEVRLGAGGETTSEGWLDAVLGPRHVVGAAVVAGHPDDVSRAIAAWMGTDEGMMLAGTRDGAERWVPDKRLLTQVQHGLKVTRSEGALRGLRSVTVRAEPVADGTLVAIEADTTSVRTANATVLSVSGLAGVATGVAAAVFPDGAPIASDVVLISAGFGLPVVTGAGIATIIHRSWLGKVRRAVVQALDGINITSRDGGEATASTPTDWRSMKQRWLGGR